jgi:hypothetical protein
MVSPAPSAPSCARALAHPLSAPSQTSIKIIIPVHDEEGWTTACSPDAGASVKARLQEAKSPKSPETLKRIEERAAQLHQLHLEATQQIAAKYNLQPRKPNSSERVRQIRGHQLRGSSPLAFRGRRAQMGRKKPSLSTAELLARSSQNKAQATKQQDDCWEDDAALIAAEQDCKPAAPEADSAEALALREEQAEAAEALREAAFRRAENAKAAKEASKAAAKEAARAAKAAQEAVAEAMAAKKAAKKDAKKGKGKPAVTPQSTYTTSVPPSARAAADPRAAAVAAAVAAKAAAQGGAAAGTLGAEAAAQRSRNAAAAAAAAAAGPLLEEVAAPSALHAQQPDELVEEWQAAAGGGFAPQLLGTHPGVSCDATGQCPLLGVRYQLRPADTDLALHPYGYDVCGMAYARLSAAEQAKFDQIPPPCMAPLVYAAGSREHRTYVLMGLVCM